MGRPDVAGLHFGSRRTLSGRTRSFPFWHNVANPSYAPHIRLDDVNRDGKDELLVTLTSGYGTGMKEEELHIFDSDAFQEILLEDWQTYAMQHVVPERVAKEGAHIRIDDAEMLVPHGIPAKDFTSGRLSGGTIVRRTARLFVTNFVKAQFTPYCRYGSLRLIRPVSWRSAMRIKAVFFRASA